jgi:hypothetical protein
MSAQILVVNQSCHELSIKTRAHHSLKWRFNRQSVHSWSLPIHGRELIKYSIKHGDNKLANVWIDHLGRIYRIQNYDRHFTVISTPEHHLNMENIIVLASKHGSRHH